MKHTLFLTMLAAALLGSGVANAAGTLYASQYTGGFIVLMNADGWDDKLVVDTPLTLTGGDAYLDLNGGVTIEFRKNQTDESICRIFTSAETMTRTVYFGSSSVINFMFDDGAEKLIAASAGTPITLIQDLDMLGLGFSSRDSATLQLNGKGYNETVELDGVQFTYVGPQSSDYTFKAGEIGFTGYYDGSHALKLAHGGPATPEPATGTLGILALAALAARRRRIFK